MEYMIFSYLGHSMISFYFACLLQKKYSQKNMFNLVGSTKSQRQIISANPKVRNKTQNILGFLALQSDILSLDYRFYLSSFPMMRRTIIT